MDELVGWEFKSGYKDIKDCSREELIEIVRVLSGSLSMLSEDMRKLRNIIAEQL